MYFVLERCDLQNTQERDLPPFLGGRSFRSGFETEGQGGCCPRYLRFMERLPCGFFSADALLAASLWRL